MSDLKQAAIYLRDYIANGAEPDQIDQIDALAGRLEYAHETSERIVSEVLAEVTAARLADRTPPV